MANWQDLSMSQRGDIIKMAVNSGVTDLNKIKKLYEESDAPAGDDVAYTDIWQENEPLQDSLDYYNDDEYALGGHLFKGTNWSSKLKIRRPLRKEPLWASNDYTEIQDNTRIGEQGNRHQNAQNKRFVDKNRRGAIEHGQWAKDHPVLNTVGNIASAAPIAVATYPIAPTIGKAVANPVVDAYFTADALVNSPKRIADIAGNIKEGNIGSALLNTGLTALDVAGAGNFISKNLRMVNDEYRRWHAFNSIPNAGYKKPFERGWNWYNNMYRNTHYNPNDLSNWAYDRPFRYDGKELTKLNDLFTQARYDAGAVYYGFPQRFNTFVKNVDGTYSYSEDLIRKRADVEDWAAPKVLHYMKNAPIGREPLIDMLGMTGGSIDRGTLRFIPSAHHKGYSKGTVSWTDTQDINPFSTKYRPAKLLTRALQYLPHKLNITKFDDNIKNFVWNNGLIRRIDKAANDFELGTITGGKPFVEKVSIPAYKEGDNYILDRPDLIPFFAKGGKIKHKNEGFIPTNDDEFYRFLVNEEGFLKTPRNIGDGVITIGSGLTNKKYIDAYRRAGRWTEAMNRKAVLEEINNRRARLSKDIPNWNSLPDTAKYALISYDYNYPLSAKKSPKLYAALRAKNWAEAAKQINATSKIAKFKNGLWNRRLREQNLFLRDFNNKPVIADRGPVLTSPTPAVDLFMPVRKALDFSQKAINYPITRTTQATKDVLTTIRNQVPQEYQNSPIFNIIPALGSDNPNIAQVPLSARDVSFNTIPRPEIPVAELIPLDEEYGNGGYLFTKNK